MHENVNTLVGHMCPTRAGNMFPTYCKSNAKLSKSDAYTAHLTTSLLFSCLISFGRCCVNRMQKKCAVGDVMKFEVFILGRQRIDQKRKKGWAEGEKRGLRKGAERG